VKSSTLEPIKFFKSYSHTPDKGESDAGQVVSGVTIPKKWQNKMAKQLGEVSYRSITTPTGSGKSVGVQLLACKDRDNGLKVLIAVPQCIIAGSYGARKLQRLDKTITDWCARFGPLDASSVSRVQEIVDFVLNPVPVTPALRVFVCTHQALVMAFGRIKVMGLDRDPWMGTSLFIDEAHHVQTSDADTDDTEIQNGLGGVVRHYLDLDSAPVTMITATWGRSDSQILPAVDFHKFKRFYMSVYEYLATCQYLQTVEQRFVIGPMLSTTEQLLERTEAKTLVFFPRVGTCWLPTVEAKTKLVGDLKRLISRNPKLRHKRVLDLVTLEGRDTRVAELRRALAAKDAAKLPDIILTLNIGTEGFDYPELGYVIQMAPRGSITESRQIQGRLFRDVSGKPTIRTDTVLPTENGEIPDDDIRGFLKIMIVSMIEDLQFYTISLRAKKPLATSENEDEPASLAEGLMLDDDVASKTLNKLANLMIASEGDESKVAEELTASIVDELSRERPELLNPSTVATATVNLVKGFLSRTTKRRAAELDLDLDLKEEILTGDFGFIRLLSYLTGHRDLKTLKKALERGVPLFTRADVHTHIVAFIAKYGKPPTFTSGKIDGDPHNRGWSTLAWAVPRLFGCSFVELLCRDYGGSRAPLVWTKEEIDERIRAYVRKHGKPPTFTSGKIDGDPHNRGWNALGCFVPQLFGCSFVELLGRDYGGARRAPWTAAEIDRLIRAYIQTHGKPPSFQSGVIEGDSHNRSWKALASIIPKLFKCTFIELLRRDYDGSSQAPPFTRTSIPPLIYAYIANHKKPPTVTSGKIEGDPHGRQWNGLARAVPKLFDCGFRELLHRDFGGSRRGPMWTTKKEIRSIIRRYFTEHGKPPTPMSGKITGDPHGRSWTSVTRAAERIFGYGLVELLRREFGGNRRKPWTLKEIHKYVRVYIEKHGQPPTSSSGKIDGDPYGRKWAAIVTYVKRHFGCPFHKLVRRVHGVSLRPPPLTRKNIDQFIRAYIKKHGRPPTLKSGKIDGDLGRTWFAVGAPGSAVWRLFGCTLSELLRSKYGGSRRNPSDRELKWAENRREVA